ncbi:MAG: hypothetical protein LBV51_02635, partial [Acholeplasmatales bacterium]|nr:hypothetical protein [Acholeplasmatales bacterium]
MKKKILLLFMLLFTFIFSFGTNLKASTNLIEESNVITDLYALYNTYDYTSLYATNDKDKNLQFKILAIKPLNDNLYIYGYTYISSPHLPFDFYFDMSTSKIQNEDGTFEENYYEYSARMINTYGTNNIFFKVSIDNMVSLNNEYRFKIRSAKYTLYATTEEHTFEDIGNDEVFIHLGSSYDDNDFLYEYYKDEYVTVLDKEVNLLLTAKDDCPLFGFEQYNSHYEDFYAFFNTDKPIDELLEVEYQYEWYTYNAKMSYWGNYVKPGDIANGSDYMGKMNGINSFSGSNESQYLEQTNADSVEIIDKTYIGNTVVSGTSIFSVQRPYFLWQTKNVTYQMNNLQDCTNLSNLDGDINKNFRDFITNVNDNRISNNKTPFKWTFKVTNSFRSVTNF